MVASLGRYTCSAGTNEAALHLYAAGTTRLTLGGQSVTLRQETGYPWDGAVAIHVEAQVSVRFALRLRIPGWCRAAAVTVNGAPVAAERDAIRGYIRLDRTWQPGDVVALAMAMPVERLYAHPAVAEDAGRVTLKRGPVVYCLEAVDHAEPLHRITLPREAALTAHFEPDLLGGVAVITGEGRAAIAEDWGNTLYRADGVRSKPCAIKAVPYCVWDHRAPGAMEVWIREG
jgi:DUF1680 family protein